MHFTIDAWTLSARIESYLPSWHLSGFLDSCSKLSPATANHGLKLPVPDHLWLKCSCSWQANRWTLRSRQFGSEWARQEPENSNPLKTYQCPQCPLLIHCLYYSCYPYELLLFLHASQWNWMLTIFNVISIPLNQQQTRRFTVTTKSKEGVGPTAGKVQETCQNLDKGKTSGPQEPLNWVDEA